MHSRMIVTLLLTIFLCTGSLGQTRSIHTSDDFILLHNDEVITPSSHDSVLIESDFDLSGPTLYHAIDLRVTADPIECPFQSLDLNVSVYDQSGVHTVLLFFSNMSDGIWRYVEMEYLPTLQFPEQYSYRFMGPLFSLDFISFYYYWANDTLGHESVSEMFETWLYCSGSSIPRTITLLGFSAASILVVLVILGIKKARNPRVV